jgi:serine/threonine-protein phosphatase PGAM5
MGTRVLYLVRHGQYHMAEESPKYGQLTPLGRRQARRVGKRLASVEFDVLHHSDMLRATETAALIAKELSAKLPTRSSKLLREGIPTAPVPGVPNHTRADARQARARMESAFSRYFKRPRSGERHELLVAHGNIIRYLVRRAMGDPIAKWVQMNITQCGLTVIVLGPRRGRVVLMSFNDVGHLPPNMRTFL